MDDGGQIPDIITIAIVTTNQLVRLGLSAVVTTHPHLRLIGEATSMLEAEELVAREMPHILIIQMEPEIDIKELAQKVKTSLPTIRIIALSGIEEKRFAGEAFSSGIDGIVLNIQPAVVLLATIDHVCRLPAAAMLHERSEGNRLEKNGSTADNDSASPVSPKYPDASLTKREQEIIALVGQALSNQDIAERLCISSMTVRHHLTSIFNKLGVTNRQKLLIRAHQHGLVEFRTFA